MLGVCQAGSLQMDTELEHELGVTLKFRCAIAVCPLKKHEVFIAYRTMYISSGTYSLPLRPSQRNIMINSKPH
eukprot:15326220-Ditylum_brightwellii.AAC.2